MDAIQVYGLISYLSAAVSVVIIFIALGRKSSPGAIPLAWLMAAVAVWCVALALEMRSTTIITKVFWSQVSYIGAMTSPALYLWFATRYHNESINKWLRPFIIGVPIAGIVAAFTNEFHFLLWPAYHLNPVTNVMVYEHGPVFWILIPIIYLFLLVGILRFVVSLFNQDQFYRNQVLIFLGASVFPIVANLLYISDKNPLPGFEITPIGFTITGLFLTWGLFQYKFLDIVPLGRNAVLENLPDAVFIVDSRDRILDVNGAALNILGLDKKPDVGSYIKQYFQEENTPLVNLPQEHNGGISEVKIKNKTLEIRRTNIYDHDQKIAGYSLLISDTTTRKNAVNAIRESEEKSRLLLENASFPLIICDLISGSLIYQNKWATDLLHHPSNGSSNVTLASLFCDPSEYKRLTTIVMKNRIVTDYETQIFASPNKKIWVLTSANIIPYANDEAILVSFNDITSRKLMEGAEKEQRYFNEAMIDSASALNSTLKFDEVLDRILNNLGKVIPHDVSNIMLVTENGDVKIVRAHGYDAKGLESLFQHGDLTVAETPYLLKMAMTSQPIVISDTHADQGWVNLPGMERTRSFLGAPILVKEKVMGYLNVESFQPHDYNKNQGRRLMAFANQAAIAIENARLFEKLEQMAVVDTLTGLYTRRQFFELGGKEIERARRYGSPLSLLMIDLDHFKQINDTYGHAVGDQILYEVCAVIASTLRKIDIPGRIGGEEFVVLLPETNQQNGLIVAERLRTAISKIKLTMENLVIDDVTASFGLSTLVDSHKDLQALITSADIAMYAAKENGRNRVEIAAPLAPNPS